MIEPTETEPKERLDDFVDAMRRIARKRPSHPTLLKEAPHGRPVRRLDEVRAAKQPVLRYLFDEHPALVGGRVNRPRYRLATELCVPRDGAIGPDARQ